MPSIGKAIQRNNPFGTKAAFGTHTRILFFLPLPSSLLPELYSASPITGVSGFVPFVVKFNHKVYKGKTKV
jgi:hypothetical protein